MTQEISGSGNAIPFDCKGKEVAGDDIHQVALHGHGAAERQIVDRD
jgi:hypothetical protein